GGSSGGSRGGLLRGLFDGDSVGRAIGSAEPPVPARPDAAAAPAVRLAPAPSPASPGTGAERFTRGQTALQQLGGPAQSSMAEHMAERRGLARALVVPPGAPRGAPREPALPQLDTSRERFATADDNPLQVTAENPVSTFSIDVDTASYSVVRRMLEAGALPPADAVRIEEMVNYFAYDYPAPDSADQPFAAHVTVTDTPWNPETKLMSIGLKGYEFAAEERPRANLTFLIDTLGSMSSPDKLPLLRQAFMLLIERLQPEDTVAIVTYAGSAGTVLKATPASERATILAALDALHAGGSTAGGQGLKLAYAEAEAAFDPDAVNRVILATDGDFNVGISDPAALKGFVERKRESGVFLSVLGFGRGNLNDALMQALAQNGNGQAAYIDTLSEARKVLVDEAGASLFPIAKDVKIQVEFNPGTVAEYRLIGYETRALAREDFNNDAVDAGEIGAGHRVTAIYEITPAGSDGRLVDDLRYTPSGDARRADGAAGSAAGGAVGSAAGTVTGSATDASDEYAFVKIRYKLPDEDESRLITRPVTPDDTRPADDPVGREARFAAAVAGFGQLLQGGRYTGAWDYDDVLALAQEARGDDPFAYRAEFLQLVRLAESIAGLQQR
ncbi:MAG: VWA domain-containing protein, partial [Pseudomonadota bacterium]